MQTIAFLEATALRGCSAFDWAVHLFKQMHDIRKAGVCVRSAILGSDYQAGSLIGHRLAPILRPSNIASSAVRGLRLSPITWCGTASSLSVRSNYVFRVCSSAVTNVSTASSTTGSPLSVC